MSYIDPSKVISPKNHVSNVEAVYDTGPQQESWSVATFDWNDTPVVGIRWNGEPGEGVGTPPSREICPRGSWSQMSCLQWCAKWLRSWREVVMRT